jgi:hypothetical protein
VIHHQETAMDERSRNPQQHVANVRGQITALIDHLRADATRVEEPQFRAICETGAEVLGGLDKAFDDYSRRNEAAWR